MKENYEEPENLFNIKKASEFAFLKKQGKKVVGKHYFFVFFPGKEKGFACIVSKKAGNAVIRNYEKRVMRSFLRTHFQSFPPVRCLVIRIPKRDGSFQDKEQDFLKALGKIKYRVANEMAE